MAAASKVDGRLSKKGMIHAGQPIDNKGPDAGLYHSTIEINDFPQKARWAYHQPHQRRQDSGTNRCLHHDQGQLLPSWQAAWWAD
ncbi:unnamed protein product [Alternaria alternata]